MINEASIITLLEKDSGFRRNLIRKRFSNGIDLIRFYHMLARMTAIPVFGPLFIRPVFNWYNRYIDSNSLVLPLSEAEKIIRASSRFYIDACDCRLEYNKCDAPLYTCLRLDFAAQVRQENHFEPHHQLSLEESLNVARNANKHGLVMTLEQCVQPYRFNLCMCCSCCCVLHTFRYTYKLETMHPGPFTPSFDALRCTRCGACATRCPAQALAIKDDHVAVDLSDCLGCGLCADICPENAIAMQCQPERMRMDTEPGWVRLLMIRLFLYGYMFPMFALFKLFGGSHHYKRLEARPRKKDAACVFPGK